VVPDAHLFLLPIHTQAGLEPAVVGRNGTNFSQCSRCREAFHRLRVQDVTEFDYD
jgi:hypothetical protein